jgi:hypothetical protein
MADGAIYTGAHDFTGATVTGVASGAATTVAYDIVIAAGQSNMSGMSTTPINATRFDAIDPMIYQYGRVGSFANGISLAGEPLDYPDSAVGVGPALHFARWYRSTLPPGRRVLVVPVAYAGTGFLTSGANGWDPAGSGNNYTNAIAQANAAITAAGPGVRVVAILWCQGENDTSMAAATYQAKLDALITGFRAGITGATTAPFLVLSMLPEFITATGNAARAINGVHQDTPGRITYAAFVQGPAGSQMGDNTHYNAAAVRANGKGLFDALAVAQARSSVAALLPGPVVSLAPTGSNGQVALAWSAPWTTGGVALTGYLVEYKTTAGSTWTTWTTTATLSATVTGLTNSTPYDFRVTPQSARGSGTASTVSATPLSATAPGAPTALSGSAGAAQVALTWTAPASDGGSAITDYVVQYRTTAGPGTWNTFADGTSTTTSATVTGLTNGTGYDFQVAAVNSAGQGAYSSIASATPTATVSLADDFNRANATSLGTASGGFTWTDNAGAFGIVSNQAQGKTSVGGLRVALPSTRSGTVSCSRLAMPTATSLARSPWMWRAVAFSRLIATMEFWLQAMLAS